MRIAITGGAGFIGTNLVEHLLTKGHSIVVVDNGSLANLEPIKDKISILPISITDLNSLAKCDLIVHLAALAGVRPSYDNPKSYYDVNVLGTLSIVSVANYYNIPLIFTSSSSVYGNTNGEASKETDSLAPVSPYAMSKYLAENIIRRMATVPVRIIRPFSVIGKYQRKDLLQAKLDEAIANNAPEFIVYGDGTQKRDFTPVSKVVDLITYFIDHSFTGIDIYNCGAGSPKNVNSLIKESGFTGKIVYTNAHKGDVDITFANTTKLNSL
jgi:nucleoside-diphosphate-sugar epimerase